MSHNVPNMLENIIAKIREMVDVNSVIGDPITTPDGTTIIPVPRSASALAVAAATMFPRMSTSRRIPSAAAQAAA